MIILLKADIHTSHLKLKIILISTTKQPGILKSAFLGLQNYT